MNSHANGQDYDAGEAQSSQLTSPTALRKLVLNYLVHHCYTDTAQAFAHDGIMSSSSSSLSRVGAGDSTLSTVQTSISASTLSKRTRNGSDYVNNGASPMASSSSTTQPPQTRSWSRMANQQITSQAHPLSAPPLSREDSNMEVEVDSLLSLAGPRTENGNGLSSNSHSSKSTKKEPEDIRMGDSQLITDGEGELNNDELSIGELRSVRIRKDIKNHILEGRIKQAIDLCNAHFPTVLNADSSTSTSADSDQNRAVKVVVKERELGSNNANISTIDLPRVLPANPTSLYPAHLSLNLQIQAFIESVRSASHAVSLNGTSQMLSASSATGVGNTLGSLSGHPHSIAASAPGITSAAVLSRSASPAPSSTSSTGSVTSANGLSGSTHSNGSAAALNPVLHAALSHAQMLFTNVQKLPGYWRAMYLKELESVTALLAYTDLETSPVRKYLDQSRRVALAEQINSAIMFRTGKPSQPLIESAVRQTSFLWSTLSNEKIVVPNDHPIFTSGTVIGVDKFETQTGVGSTGVATNSGNGTERTKIKGKVLPSWNLHSFLLER